MCCDNEILTINRRSDLHEVLEIVHRYEDCSSTIYGWTSVYWRFGKFNSLDKTPWGWRWRMPKRVGLLVKQCNLVYEKWCIKRWFDADW
jgi:hypothetical protein